jgi:hypothetical protein
MSDSIQTFVTDILTKALYPILITFSIAVATIVALWLLGIEDVEPQEPPVLRPKIPFIGHMIGLLSHHNNYFTMLRFVISPNCWTKY